MRPSTKAVVNSILLHPIVLCSISCTWSNYNKSKACVKAEEGTLHKYRLSQWSLHYYFLKKIAKIFLWCLSLIILYQQEKGG